MELSFAPMEGITSYTYRNTHQELFGGADSYYAPFINPSDQEKVSKKGMRDILPELNLGVPLKVQVLTNCAESFTRFAKKIQAAGYDEVNINIGCPAARVVQKGRGAGFLRDTDGLERFFDEIFSRNDISVSVKTRIGFSGNEELEDLMEIYNRYPFSHLIVHPRTREQFYNGTPDLDAFSYAYKSASCDICYNGDIWSLADYQAITERFPDISGVMLGRGAIRNPALFREIRGGAPLTTEELASFTETLSTRYRAVLDSEVFTLHKLKEIWVYMIGNYPEEKKIYKRLKKATTVSEFLHAVRELPPLSAERTL